MDRKPKKGSTRFVLFVVIAGLSLCTGCPCLLWFLVFGEQRTVVENRQHEQPEEEFTDDRIEDKAQLPFDQRLVDRRAFGQSRINSSAAVIRLAMPPIQREAETELVTLHASYAAAVAAAPRWMHLDILPSVNLLDGKAKQFDDGLYAALDRAYYLGLDGALPSHVRLVRRFYEQAGPDNPAAPFLAAALELAGETVAANDTNSKAKVLEAFKQNEVRSKPIGFYTWNETLSECFRFLRFLQTPLDSRCPEVQALTQLLAKDARLSADYAKAVAFYSRLTNPVSIPALDEPNLGAGKPLVAFLPPSTSRETELFNRLLGVGPLPSGELMKQLVRRIRSGEVDLKPRPNRDRKSVV